MDKIKLIWIESILSNDENSTDQELLELFTSHNIPDKVAREYIGMRNQYLYGLVVKVK